MVNSGSIYPDTSAKKTPDSHEFFCNDGECSLELVSKLSKRMTNYFRPFHCSHSFIQPNQNNSCMKKVIPENQFAEILVFCKNNTLLFDRYTQYLPIGNRTVKLGDIDNFKAFVSQG